jgi:hypothetical protein
MIKSLESIESYNKDPVNQQGPTKSKANGKGGRGNFAVDAIVATSEPQVPKPRTKNLRGQKENEKKNCSLEVGKTNAELPGHTLPEKLANSHSLTSSES